MMDFGDAIRSMKRGKKVAREGWNGEGMFLYYVPRGSYLALTYVAKSIADAAGKVQYKDYIAMKTVDGEVVPWLASQTDILSNDWVIV